MKLFVYVKNFGKIREAKIDISNFTIFVGNSNSGKTYVMQLIYGILDRLKRVNQFKANFLTDFDGEVELNEDMYFQLNNDMNRYFEKYKTEIIKDIFNKDISIDELRVDIVPEEKDEIILSFKDGDTGNIALSTNEEKNVEKVKWVKLIQKEEKSIIRQQEFGFLDWDIESDINEKKQLLYNQLVRFIFDIGQFDKTSVLYMPASRTGILMLYKYFFSERDKNSQMFFNRRKNEMILSDREEKGNELGLTTPVYDFLQFLLRYSEEGGKKKNEVLIDFIQKNLIDGKVESSMGNFVYRQNKSDSFIPLYLASSMVNELTPIIMVLSNKVQYRYILYDEIETCLHPFKQKEMARFLNRLCNNGFRMIVSTHSDTMAAKLNNLFLLSFMDDKESQKEKMQKLGLCEDDLLKNKNVKVYQFVNDEEGKSAVSELEFRTTPYVGYDFSLFTENSMELYNEAEIILKDN